MINPYWNKWSRCSNGKQTRKRTYKNIGTRGSCSGKQKETRSCNRKNCQQNSSRSQCIITEWGDWSKCSKKCKQTREMIFKEWRIQGEICSGREIRTCKTKKCRRTRMDSFQSNDATSLTDETWSMETKTISGRSSQGGYLFYTPILQKQ